MELGGDWSTIPSMAGTMTSRQETKVVVVRLKGEIGVGMEDETELDRMGIGLSWIVK